MPIPNEKLLSMYRDLLTARRLGERTWELYGEGLVAWSTGTHRPTCEEAPPIAVQHALKEGDFFRPTFRTHPMHFARQDGSYSLRDILAVEMNRDVYKVGGHSYYLDPEIGNVGHRVCLGEEICISVGAALAAQIRGTDQVVVQIVGDGAANRGGTHEAMVVAAAKKLPIVFGIQNNKYAANTPWQLAYAIQDLSDRAKAYGFPGETVDGNDIVACYETAKKYIDRARYGHGPGLIVFDTWRVQGHAGKDAQQYRPRGEARRWWAYDPLPRFQNRLIVMGLLTEADVKKLEAEVKAEIDEAVEEAKAVPEWSLEEHEKTAIDQLASWS